MASQPPGNVHISQLSKSSSADLSESTPDPGGSDAIAAGCKVQSDSDAVSSRKEERDCVNMAKRNKKASGNDVDKPSNVGPVGPDKDNVLGTISPNTATTDRPAIEVKKWSQSKNLVNIELNAGRRLNKNDLSAELEEDSCTIKLKDGRVWTCQFAGKIIPNDCKVMLQKFLIIMKLPKQVKDVAWPQLEFLEPKEKDAEMEDNTSTVITGEEKAAGTATPTEEKVEEDASKDNMDISNSQATLEDHSNVGKTETAEVIDLPLVKHNFYEVGPELAMVQLDIYVKGIKKETLEVIFAESCLTVRFQSNDEKFLKLHENSNEDSVFQWKLDLFDKVSEENCKFRLAPTKLEVKLKKQLPKRWAQIEARTQQVGETPAANTWVPLNSKNTQSDSLANVDVKTNSRVMFDDMELEAESERKQSLDAMEKENLPSTSLGQTRASAESSKEKPTCMVSPLSKPEWSQIVTPGMTGLDNMGNTCFMNSVLQVLANTTELLDYFLESQFQKEINEDNPLGTGGKLAVAFAVLLRHLWSGKYRSYAPSKLKNIVATKASQFTGYAQHDAQEFMAFLLDGLHEDLNRIKEKPYTEMKDSDGRPDEVVANEAWETYKKRNDSFIVDLFQGQYKSKLVCPNCGKISITFDPFMILPVPIPKKKRLMPVYFFSRDPYKKPVKMMVRLSNDATTDSLTKCVQDITGVNPTNQRVFTVYKSKYLAFHGKGASIAHVPSTDTIFVCEVLSEKLAGEPVLEIPIVQRRTIPVMEITKCSHCRVTFEKPQELKRCTRCYKVGYCNQQCQKVDWGRHRPNCRYSPELVGLPFILSLPKSQATYTRVCNTLENYSRYSVDVFHAPIRSGSPPSPAESGESGSSRNTPQRESSASMTSSTESYSKSSSMTTLESFGTADSLQGEDGGKDSALGRESEFDQSETSTSQPADVAVDNSPSTSSHESFVEVPDIDSQSHEDSGIHFSVDGEEENQDSTLTDRSEDSNQSGSTLVLDQVGDYTRIEGTDGGEQCVPTQYVMGRQRLDGLGVMPMFHLKPCDKDGCSIKGAEGTRLEDKGDEPLDFSSLSCLAMDWKNNDKASSYVLVNSKELECDEDASTMTAFDENITSLEQCLSLFTEPEILSPEHAWYCPSCREHREASKQLSIWRLPHTLIIQLKRFSFRNFIWRDKIDKVITYPIRGLDLTPYFIGNLPSSEPPPIYDLYGVTNHHGGILGGHYTSYARLPNTEDWKVNNMDWRLFDDSLVYKTLEKNVVTRSAYVLFYRRRDLIVPLPTPMPSAETLEDADEEIDKDDEEDSNIKILSTSSLQPSESTAEEQAAEVEVNPESGEVTEATDASSITPEYRSSYTDMDAVD